MTLMAFGRVARLVTARSTSRSNFRIGLEAIEKATGRLSNGPGAEYEGEGIGFRHGDVLFGKLRPNLRKVWLADTHGDAVGDFHVYRPVPGLMSSRYLAYLVQSEPFLEPVIASVQGAKMPRADWGTVRNVKVWAPDLSEQRTISDFLDRETAQIDAFIAKNEELIVLLTERRGALRAELATGSRSPEPRKATGLFWAPEVPSTWEVVRLTSVARLESGHTPSRSVAEYWRENECVIPWISLNDVGHMASAEYLESTINQISEAGLAGSSARILPAGTVVLSRDATIGRSSIMAVPMATSQHFADWVCGDKLMPRYLWLLFTSCMQGLFESLTNGSTLRTIGIPDLKSFRIPLPPLADQARIVESALAADQQFKAVIQTAARAGSLARERRAALITAAVTGKIDVGVAA